MARILDGKTIAAQIKEEIKAEVKKWQAKGINPCLGVLLVGEDAASAAYAKFLEKVAAGVGAKFHLEQLKKDAAEDSVLAVIDELNHNRDIHGILLLLPLPKHIDKQRVMDAILPAKDVDGVHPVNRGYILSGGQCIYPATPLSCLEILKRSHISMDGKHAVVVGRGETVGKPLLYMAVAENATVTVCHSRTTDLSHHTRQADILFTAVGKPGLITKDMVKPGAVVVDAGISEVDGKIYGDVDFEGVKEVAGAITPVPGGVGSLTTAMMLKNLLKGIAIQDALVELKVN
ncbi:methylenetetrahydrofolate dehydrogenase (NADP+)/methenyltetrahydrofolate cyclohydrolase [Desulfohalotomaculum tongense]|uniref:bifunctional 5,10-methylenetetrahydrofolate dehydrogenase/5,10-methenyltetrahydrofolate cyclohydrolase n=1 Tax=Desulforadius tongensis TaxID=1216062 RepID=UPI00195E23DA|nr:bifunctional 5,10-methylenetetrahydrofolate dehydrogenase/5,10-methenyltetrahydrofolate cyclohydrolase [Desulforadius tongensis]MBM7855494.1 methylenetetrahydrofolate dehydrogenase (NADP+)/methenyltetrahydrofolate cyclohydrolase [Desulforadius tongensis]